MPAPLRALATRRGEPLSFASDVLERSKALLRGSKAQPFEFYNQLRSKLPETPLGLMFREALQQPPRIMTRDEFLASARPPKWKAAAVRRGDMDEDLLHEAATDLLYEEPFRTRINEAIIEEALRDTDALREVQRLFDPAYATQLDEMGLLDELAGVMRARGWRGGTDVPMENLIGQATNEDMLRIAREWGPRVPWSTVDDVLSDIHHDIVLDNFYVDALAQARRLAGAQRGQGASWSGYQRIAQLPRYFELGLSSPGRPWYREEPRLAAMTESMYPQALRGARIKERAADMQHMENPELIGHVRGSADPRAGTVAIEELQADPLQKGMKHPTFYNAYGALGKMAMQLAARRGYSNIIFPSGDVVASVRGEKSAPAMRRIYDRDLEEQLYGPVEKTFGIRPSTNSGPSPHGSLKPGRWLRYDLADPELRRAMATSMPHFAPGGKVPRDLVRRLSQRLTKLQRALGGDQPEVAGLVLPGPVEAPGAELRLRDAEEAYARFWKQFEGAKDWGLGSFTSDASPYAAQFADRRRQLLNDVEKARRNFEVASKTPIVASWPPRHGDPLSGGTYLTEKRLAPLIQLYMAERRGPSTLVHTHPRPSFPSLSNIDASYWADLLSRKGAQPSDLGMAVMQMGYMGQRPTWTSLSGVRPPTNEVLPVLHGLDLPVSAWDDLDDLGTRLRSDVERYGDADTEQLGTLLGQLRLRDAGVANFNASLGGSFAPYAKELSELARAHRAGFAGGGQVKRFIKPQVWKSALDQLKAERDFANTIQRAGVTDPVSALVAIRAQTQAGLGDTFLAQREAAAPASPSRRKFIKDAGALAARQALPDVGLEALVAPVARQALTPIAEQAAMPFDALAWYKTALDKLDEYAPEQTIEDIIYDANKGRSKKPMQSGAGARKVWEILGGKPPGAPSNVLQHLSDLQYTPGSLDFLLYGNNSPKEAFRSLPGFEYGMRRAPTFEKWKKRYWGAPARSGLTDQQWAMLMRERLGKLVGEEPGQDDAMQWYNDVLDDLYWRAHDYWLDHVK